MPYKWQVFEVRERKNDREQPPYASRRIYTRPSGQESAGAGLAEQRGHCSSHSCYADRACHCELQQHERGEFAIVKRRLSAMEAIGLRFMVFVESDAALRRYVILIRGRGPDGPALPSEQGSSQAVLYMVITNVYWRISKWVFCEWLLKACDTLIIRKLHIASIEAFQGVHLTRHLLLALYSNPSS